MACRYYHNFATMQSFQVYHKTVVAVNALSARVTEGVPINNSLSLTIFEFSVATYSNISRAYESAHARAHFILFLC